jgi:hypothetical protein
VKRSTAYVPCRWINRASHLGFDPSILKTERPPGSLKNSDGPRRYELRHDKRGVVYFLQYRRDKRISRHVVEWPRLVNDGKGNGVRLTHSIHYPRGKRRIAGRVGYKHLLARGHRKTGEWSVFRPNKGMTEDLREPPGGQTNRPTTDSRQARNYGNDRVPEVEAQESGWRESQRHSARRDAA